ncbi:MAG: hypothetical protein EHM42_07120, partial [Planctomycetaceae bacterium]
SKPLLGFGGGGNDRLLSGAAADVLIGGAGDDTLNAGAGNDTYRFNSDDVLGSDTLTDAHGLDLLDFAPTRNASVSLDLSLTTPQVVNSHLTLQLQSASAFENLVGGEGDDLLIGNALANLLSGNGGDDELRGGIGNDTYRFVMDSPLGFDRIVENANGGSDTLDFSQSTAHGATVNLGFASRQSVSSVLDLQFVNLGQIENLTGSRLADSLTGDGLANRITGLGGDDYLAGAGGNDVYLFDADLPLGFDTVFEVAGDGIDLLDYSTTASVSVVVDLAVATQQAVNANHRLALTGGDFENITGGSKNDTLSGNHLANTFVGGPGNDLLTGRNGDDVYSFNAAMQLGSDTVVETSTGGSDGLSFAATTSSSAAVVVDLGSSAAQSINSNLVLTLSGTSVIENVVGGPGNDTLMGNDLENVLSGGPGNDTLAGGPGDDTYAFKADAALGVDSLIELPGAGRDLLDFATGSTAVTVDLGLTTTQVVNSRLSLRLSSANDFEMVVGTSGSDVLRGNAADNVLIGGTGNDTLMGFGGSDLIVGRGGADSLNGGDGEDILIAGLVSFFDETTATLDRSALLAIVAEWTRRDRNYSDRIAKLRTGGGLNGSYVLSPLTVLTDGTAIDTLTGGAGLDWFWSFANDVENDRNSPAEETLN